MTKLEKRRVPFERRFKVDLQDLIKVQLERWNGGCLRQGVTVSDVAFHLFPDDHKTLWLIDELKLDARNPLHWRAMVEAFIQTYVRKRGAPRKVGELVRLARDMDAVRQEKLGGVWSAAAAAKHLKLDSAYRARYRHVGASALSKRIGRIAKEIGPMDDGAMARAYGIYFEPRSNNPFIEPNEEPDEE
jgi:hypothetical protein